MTNSFSNILSQGLFNLIFAHFDEEDPDNGLKMYAKQTKQEDICAA